MSHRVFINCCSQRILLRDFLMIIHYISVHLKYKFVLIVNIKTNLAFEGKNMLQIYLNIPQPHMLTTFYDRQQRFQMSSHLKAWRHIFILFSIRKAASHLQVYSEAFENYKCQEKWSMLDTNVKCFIDT